MDFNSTTPSRALLRQQALMLRNSLNPVERQQFDARIMAQLKDLLDCGATSIGVYWPMRNEPDLRALWTHWHTQGMTIALPTIVAKNQALRFVRWDPNMLLSPTAYGAQVPSSEEIVVPQFLVIPCVAFDLQLYRLGYGGGFYDRTLASGKFQTIGVAYQCCILDSINPQSHDLPLDHIVTELYIAEVKSIQTRQQPRRE